MSLEDLHSNCGLCVFRDLCVPLNQCLGKNLTLKDAIELRNLKITALVLQRERLHSQSSTQGEISKQ